MQGLAGHSGRSACALTGRELGNVFKGQGAKLPLEIGLTFLMPLKIPPCHDRGNFLVQISEAGKNVSKKMCVIITVNSL